nr:ArmA_Rmt [uncultured bacterium]
MNNELFEKLSVNKKYRDVCPDTIRRVIAECEGRYKKAKDMDKAVREKLHGITSAFMSEHEYKKARVLAGEFSPENLESLLACHASTRERLPLAAMDALYGRIFELTGVPAALLDLACGINPVYFLARYPLMQVTGADISGQSINIITRCGGRALHNDLLCTDSIPAERYDVALLFKILPLLDRQQEGSAMEVLNAVNAKFIVVSFPTRTLGGRNVGMEDNYSAWMDAHLPENREIAARFTTDNELFYILKEK